jgi:hypothetical protein
MYAPALEAELLVIDEFDTWSIGDLIAFMSPLCVSPDPLVPQEPPASDV